MNKTRSNFAAVAVSFFVSLIAEAQGGRPGFNAPETSGRQLIPNVPVPLPEGTPGIGDLTPISQPTPDYVSGTTLFDVTAPDYTTVTSLTEGDCTVTFTPALQARTVPRSWATWGYPPDTETPTPRVLYTLGLRAITLTFNEGCAASTLGFEAEPNAFSDQILTATYYADTLSLGSITRIVTGRSRRAPIRCGFRDANHPRGVSTAAGRTLSSRESAMRFRRATPLCWALLPMPTGATRLRAR